MNHLTTLCGLALCSAAVTAQSHLLLPATANPQFEMPFYTLLPFMQVNCRVQFFYGEAEVGASAFVADQLEWRYDGPIPRVGHPGPFQIQRLRIAIGTTTVGTPDARFDENLTQPLQTVFDGPWTYLPDPGSVFPHPWGAPNNSLTFPFQVPVALTVPTGGWLVVDVRMEGNNIANFGYSHAILDGATTTGGPVDGSATPFGQGCSIGGSTPAPAIGSNGVHAPGAAYFLTGTNLGANAPVFAIFGLSNASGPLGSLPVQLPGTACNVLTSSDFYRLMVADGSGSILGSQAGAALAVPPAAAFNGMLLYSQLASFAPGANTLGVALSNGLAVTLGTYSAPGRRTFVVGNGDNANATVANEVSAFGLAMRLRTL